MSCQGCRDRMRPSCPTSCPHIEIEQKGISVLWRRPLVGSCRASPVLFFDLTPIGVQFSYHVTSDWEPYEHSCDGRRTSAGPRCAGQTGRQHACPSRGRSGLGQGLQKGRSPRGPLQWCSLSLRCPGVQEACGRSLTQVCAPSHLASSLLSVYSTDLF